MTSDANIIRPGLVLKPIEHPDELEVLRNAAAGDDHQLIIPTHGLWREGDGRPEAVGYASLCATPVVHVWLHSQKVQARESFAVIRKLEAMTAELGHGIAVVPCWPQSPFFALMPKMGYAPFLETTLFAKKVCPNAQSISLRRRD